MKLALVAAWFLQGSIVAQASPDGPWGFVAAYGTAAPFAALCLWVMSKKDREIDVLRTEIQAVTDKGMGQVVPALIHSTDAVTDSVKAIEAATVMMHQLQARTVDAEMLGRLIRVLGRLERKLGLSDDTVD